MEKEVMCLDGTQSKDLDMPNIQKKKRISAFIIDETVIQIGNEHFCWLWFCIEPVHISRFGIYISQKREIVNK